MFAKANNEADRGFAPPLSLDLALTLPRPIRPLGRAKRTGSRYDLADDHLRSHLLAIRRV